MFKRACTARAAPARSLLVLVALLVFLMCAPGSVAKPRTRVGSDLDSVPDSEEDDSWREWGKRAEPKRIEEPTQEALKKGFSELQLSIVSVDPARVKARHGSAKAMLTKWTGMLAEAGLRGKHVSFEPAGEAQDDIVVRYGDARDFDTLVLEFLMRQPEVSSALVHGAALTKQQYWASHPEIEYDDEL